MRVKFFLSLVFTMLAPLCNAQSKEDTVYTKVEVEAQFPGGSYACARYLTKQLIKYQDYPPVKLVVDFVITKDGKVDSVKLEVPTNTDLDKKIIDLFLNMPRWEPATQNGNKVFALRRQQITIGNFEE